MTRTISAVLIMQFAIFPDDIFTGGLYCITSIQLSWCMLYRRRVPMSPDLYDVNTGLTRQQKMDLRGEVSNMRTTLLSYTVVLVMATVVIQIVCWYGYTAVMMGVDAMLELSKDLVGNEPAIVAVTFCLSWVKGYFPSASGVRDCQHEIRNYCVLSQ